MHFNSNVFHAFITVRPTMMFAVRQQPLLSVVFLSKAPTRPLSNTKLSSGGELSSVPEEVEGKTQDLSNY